MKQGEIWYINLDPTVGAEIQKVRPAVIVNDNALGKLPLNGLDRSFQNKIRQVEQIQGQIDKAVSI